MQLQHIQQKIHEIRGMKVMLDFDLAKLYETETRILKQAVKRNLDRFPPDFMFQLDNKDISLMVSQLVIPSKSYLGGAKPYAFTEQGVAMLSSILNSSKYDKKFKDVYEALHYLLDKDKKPAERTTIGFKVKK